MCFSKLLITMPWFSVLQAAVWLFTNMCVCVFV